MAKNKPKVDQNGKKLKKKVKADVAKVLNKNNLSRKMLLGMNPYLQCLLDPFNAGGAKIPDLNMTASGTFQIVDRQTLTVGSSGVVGICYGAASTSSSNAQGGSLVPVSITGTTVFPFAVGMLVSGSATNSTSDIFFGNTKIYLTNWASVIGVVPQTYSKVRLVSAGLIFQYLGAPLNAKGKASVGFAPRNQYRTTSSSGLTVANILSLPGAKAIPINQLSGGLVIYQPQDSASLEYVDTTSTSQNVNVGAVWDTDANLRAAVGGELWMAFDGLTSGDTIQCTAVLNYEGIPRTNTFNVIAATPSPNDPVSLTHALNTIQVMPTTLATSAPAEFGSGKSAISGSTQESAVMPHPYQASPTPLVSGSSVVENSQQKENPTGMFDSILGGATDFLKKIPGIIDEFSPMLEGIATMFL